MKAEITNMVKIKNASIDTEGIKTTRLTYRELYVEYDNGSYVNLTNISIEDYINLLNSIKKARYQNYES
jgi:hypothetical protein